MCPPPNLLGRTIDHGYEAITELVNFLDKHMGLSIVIAAGYEKDMEERLSTGDLDSQQVFGDQGREEAVAYPQTGKPGPLTECP